MGKTKTLAGALLAIATLTVTGCSGGGAPSTETAEAPTDPGKATGTITVLTQRTDLVQSGAMDAYATEFNKIYPKVKVKFEGLTDYEGEVKIRMNTEDYGDVLMIPAAVSKNDYPKFFAPLGSSIEMSDKYRFSDKTAVGSKVYGIAQFGTANGFVYNKALWKKAGITAWPDSPEEFLAGLKAIRSKTGATPTTPTSRTAGRWSSGAATSARPRAVKKPTTGSPVRSLRGSRAASSGRSTPCCTTSSRTASQRRTPAPPTGKPRRACSPRARSVP